MFWTWVGIILVQAILWPFLVILIFNKIANEESKPAWIVGGAGALTATLLVFHYVATSDWLDQLASAPSRFDFSNLHSSPFPCSPGLFHIYYRLLFPFPWRNQLRRGGHWLVLLPNV